MGALALELVPLVVQNPHRDELVGLDLVEADVNAEIERGPQVESAPNQQAGLGGLGRVELVERAMITTPAVGSVRAQTGLAQVVAPECPMDEVTQGGLVRPLPS